MCPSFSLFSISVSSTQPPCLTWATAVVFKMTSLLSLLSPSVHCTHNPNNLIICCLKPFKVFLCTQIKWALSYPSNPVMYPVESVLSTQHCQLAGSFLRKKHVDSCHGLEFLLWVWSELDGNETKSPSPSHFLKKNILKGKPFSFNIIAFSKPYKTTHQN